MINDNLVGKIGYVDNINLPGLENKPGGHYVYIKEIKKKKCSVYTIVSLKDESGKFIKKKYDELRKGIIVPIPRNDLNLPRYSAFDLRMIEDVKVKDISFNHSVRLKNKKAFYLRNLR